MRDRRRPVGASGGCRNAALVAEGEAVGDYQRHRDRVHLAATRASDVEVISVGRHRSVRADSRGRRHIRGATVGANTDVALNYRGVNFCICYIRLRVR